MHSFHNVIPLVPTPYFFGVRGLIEIRFLKREVEMRGRRELDGWSVSCCRTTSFIISFHIGRSAYMLFIFIGRRGGRSVWIDAYDLDCCTLMKCFSSAPEEEEAWSRWDLISMRWWDLRTSVPRIAFHFVSFLFDFLWFLEQNVGWTSLKVVVCSSFLKVNRLKVWQE